MSDTAIMSLVTGAVTIATMVIGFLTLWVKLRYGVEKTEEAAASARKAVATAEDRAQVVVAKLDDNTKITKETSKKLNGGLDATLDEKIRPVHETLVSHIDQDKKDLEEVKAKFQELTEYVHQRNHDILDAINTQSNKINLLLAGAELKPPPEKKGES